jgi:integrase
LDWGCRVLTELTIRKLSPRDGKRVEVWDEKTPGFGVRVSPSGTKTFVLMYYVGQRKRRLTLGRYPIISLAGARRMALDALNRVANGSDPQAERRNARTSLHFNEVVEDFVNTHAAQHYRPSHAHETARLLRARFVAAWAQRDIKDISKGDVIKLLDNVTGAGTPSAAIHALATIRKFFNWCVERGIVEANPCANLSRPALVGSRDRVLDNDEVAAVWAAVNTLDAPFSHIVRLLLLTAQRRGEVAGMHWSEISFEERMWSIPASRTKSNRAQLLPLSPLALSVIASIPRVDDDIVFPARGNASAHPSGFSKVKRRLDELSGVTDWTLHDLRRTVATHMAGMGVAPHVIERILNHTTGILGGVAGIYNRFQYLPEMRAALELWGQHIERLIGQAAGISVSA